MEVYTTTPHHVSCVDAEESSRRAVAGVGWREAGDRHSFCKALSCCFHVLTDLCINSSNLASVICLLTQLGFYRMDTASMELPPHPPPPSAACGGSAGVCVAPETPLSEWSQQQRGSRRRKMSARTDKGCGTQQPGTGPAVENEIPTRGNLTRHQPAQDGARGVGEAVGHGDNVLLAWKNQQVAPDKAQGARGEAALQGHRCWEGITQSF